MRIVLWILQVLLAALFVWHGWIYTAPPVEMLDMINAILAPGLRTFIGVAELIAAVGLILPAATRILPWLTPLAAAGLMIVMGSAAVFHFSRGETTNAISAVVIFVLVTIVAYMRWKVYPITPRNTSTVLA
ncbi:MAG: DoxX family protein [Roseiflexaceae bacterium]